MANCWVAVAHSLHLAVPITGNAKTTYRDLLSLADLDSEGELCDDGQLVCYTLFPAEMKKRAEQKVAFLVCRVCKWGCRANKTA